MDLVITPHRLAGTVAVPASKSMAHRLLICAGLSDGVSCITGVSFSKDIEATISVMKAFGADFQVEGDTVTVTGIRKPAASCIADCCESGSTLRFLIPVAAALGIETEFRGQGRLPQRPITPYLREFSGKGAAFDYRNTMPFTVKGQLRSGKFMLEGDISSQFVTGLLLSLPLLEGDSEICLTSPLQSRPYADMTLDCLNRFGVTVTETADGYRIPGGQRFQPVRERVEGDFSQAAFFLAANALGSSVTLANMPETSVQGDRRMADILQEMYGTNGVCTVDASDIPDLVPIMAVAASFAPCVTKITGAERLRIKESDRLKTTASLLNTLGGDVRILPDGLEIHPVGTLHGGTISSAGDHRIAMCAAIAATRADAPVMIKGAECVEKSYPAFFEDYQALGGIVNGIRLE